MASVAEKPQPVRVLYCAACSLPAEYCEFGPDFEKCKPWLRQHARDLYPDLFAKEESDGKQVDNTTEQLQSMKISRPGDGGGDTSATSA